MKTIQTMLSEMNGRMTLADLVEGVQRIARSDEEVVAILTHLICTRRVKIGREAHPVRLAA